MTHLKPWLGQKEKSCLLSMFLPWLQSSFWWFFDFSQVFPQNVKNTVLKTPAEFFSLLSHFFPPPLSMNSCAGHFCRAAGQSGGLLPSNHLLSWGSLQNLLYFYLKEYLEHLCLEFWFAEWAFSSLEFSRSSCTGVLWFKPSLELNTSQLLTSDPNRM